MSFSINTIEFDMINLPEKQEQLPNAFPPMNVTKSILINDSLNLLPPKKKASKPMYAIDYGILKFLINLWL